MALDEKGHGSGAFLFLAFVPVVGLLALVQCTGFVAADDAADASAEAAADVIVGPADSSQPDTSTCVRAPYAVGAEINRGSVCGVGACRTHLTGDCPKVSVDGAVPSVCTAAFPAESCTTPTDDNCDGVLDEGCEGASATAGIRCAGCAWGNLVKRGADGTISGQNGNYQDAVNTTDCINTALCGFGEFRWMRNMRGAGTTCATFCAQIGGSCAEECTTSQPACDPIAASVNQGGKRFGTYTADYKCLEIGSNQQPTGLPNTGSCAFVPKDNGFGPLADNRFTYNCCCKL